MLKEPTASMLVFLFFISNTLAGTGSSHLSQNEEEKSSRKAQIRSSSELSNTDLLVSLGAGAALAGALFAAYKMSSSSSSRDIGKLDEKEAPQTTFSIKASRENQVSSFLPSTTPIAVLSIPTIDLSIYEIELRREARTFDLHPVYNSNPRNHLRQAIYKLQKAYYLSQAKEDEMVRIITGTGKNRPGPNYRLRDNVFQWLQESYLHRRVERYWTQDEGMINIILRKRMLEE